MITPNIINKGFKSLKQLRETFKTKEDCIEFLEEVRWEGVPVSPYDITSRVSKHKDGWYKCKNTGKEFNVLTGTFLEGTHISLVIWFEVIFRMHSDKRSLPSTLISRDYGITQKTAWHMIQKIQHVMEKENFSQLKGVVEVDEYVEGGALKNMHYDKKLAVKENGTYQNKKPLQGFAKRNGDAVIRTIPNMHEGTLNAGVLKYVEPGSTLYSDDNPSYQKLPPIYERGVVVHSKGNYVNKENKNIYTNTIEALWATFNRTIKTHIHVSGKHLQNYANGVVFRYNTRKMKSGDATIWLLSNVENTRITWKEIRDGRHKQHNRNQARVA